MTEEEQREYEEHLKEINGFKRSVIKWAIILLAGWLMISTILPTFFDIKLVGDEWNLLNRKRQKQMAETVDDLEDEYEERQEQTVINDLLDEIDGLWEVYSDNEFTGDVLNFSSDRESAETEAEVARIGDIFKDYGRKGMIAIRDIEIESLEDKEFGGEIKNGDSDWRWTRLSLYKDRLEIYLEEKDGSYKRVQDLHFRRAKE
jgi:hypothetical protein